MKTQKRLAAKILKVGKTTVWIDPEYVDELEGAMTRGDIRKFIGLGAIKAKPIVGNSRGRVRKRKEQIKKGRRSGHGKRKGSANARTSKKKAWIKKIRAQRALLKEMRDRGDLGKTEYRKTYRLAKAGTFKTKSHLKTYVKSMKKY